MAPFGPLILVIRLLGEFGDQAHRYAVQKSHIRSDLAIIFLHRPVVRQHLVLSKHAYGSIFPFKHLHLSRNNVIAVFFLLKLNSIGSITLFTHLRFLNGFTIIRDPANPVANPKIQLIQVECNFDKYLFIEGAKEGILS